MISKLNGTPGRGQSLSRKKIIIPQIYSKSKQKKKGQFRKQKQRSQCSIQYGTDDRKRSHPSQKQYQQLKQLVSTCPQCKLKLCQFATKKPHTHIQKSTQTTHKPFLLDLIQQRIQSICRQNSKMNQIIQEKDEDINQRNMELNQIEQKFTNIIYTLGQEICYHKIKAKDQQQLKHEIRTNTETPAYIKALMQDFNQ